MEPPRAIAIVGPTASGKSAVALALAEKLGGEIISVDSMQVYRGLDIGTAKATAVERARVPHHLIDVADLAEPFDAAKFVEHARCAETDIIDRGKWPILCGGTGLYLKAWLDGLGTAPAANPALRQELESTPLDRLLQELAACDPKTFEHIDRGNARRVVRAVEVVRLTGKPFSEQRADWKPSETDTKTRNAKPRTHIFGLLRDTTDLRQRIDARVDEMFARGLVAETQSLLAHGLEQNRTAMQAIGYRQVVEHLRGERSLSDTVALVKTKTRQFAKRQTTWFRRQLPVQWIEVEANETTTAIVSRIISALPR